MKGLLPMRVTISLSTSSFYKVFRNDKNAQYGINQMCTVVSQKCNICQLNSYSI